MSLCVCESVLTIFSSYSSGFPEGSRETGRSQEGRWKDGAETEGAHFSQHDDPDEAAGGRVLRDVEQLGQSSYSC